MRLSVDSADSKSYLSNRDNVAHSPEFFKSGVVERLVDLYQRKRAFADLFSAEIEASDIDRLAADEGRDSAEHARKVSIENEQHMPFRNHLEIEVVYADDARIAFAEQRSAYLALAVARFRSHRDHAGEVPRAPGQRLRHLDTALLGDYRRIDHVDALDHG